MSYERFREGAAKLEEVLGFAPETGADFQRISVESLGEVWAREGLPTRDRRLITITLLALLGREALMDLQLHLRQAMARGELSRRELEEVMIHTAHYAGWPVAQAGFDALTGVAAQLRGERDAGERTDERDEPSTKR